MKNMHIHGMSRAQASRKKILGHLREKAFNAAFANPEARIYFSSATPDCVVSDVRLKRKLKTELGCHEYTVSVKGGDNLQFHLGVVDGLTKNVAVKDVKINGRSHTKVLHRVGFEKQKEILRSIRFWKKYLGKGAVLCYLDGKLKKNGNTWLFFNMRDVIRFVSSRIKWRRLATGRLKGDYLGTQYLTYEYRSEKDQFVLGAHGGGKGRAFIYLLKDKIGNLAVCA